MPIVEILEQHGSVTNKEKLLPLISSLSRKFEVDPACMDEAEVYYHSLKSNTLFESLDKYDKDVAFKIVRFPKTRNYFDRAWSFSFIKVKAGKSFIWKGAHAGTYDSLFDGIKSKIKSSGIRRIKSSDSNGIKLPAQVGRMHSVDYVEVRKLAHLIHDSLFDQREWDILKGVDGVARYLSVYIFIGRERYIAGKTEDHGLKVVQEGNDSYFIINSGLLDKFANFIFIKCKVKLFDNVSNREKLIKVVSCEVLSEVLLIAESTKLKALMTTEKDFLSFPDDKIFFNYTQSLNHMFVENWSRLSSESEQVYTPDQLFTSLSSSIDFSLKMAQIDSSFIVPMYNLKDNSVVYLIPLYIGSVALNTPICAVQLGKTQEGIWAPVTILTLEMARTSSRVLKKLPPNWIMEIPSTV